MNPKPRMARSGSAVRAVARGTAWLASLLVLAGCATSPLGRSQLKLFDEATMANMGAAAFTQIQSGTRQTESPGERRYVECIANRIVTQTGGDPENWEVRVFAGDERNAFALPGGKIGVYSGMVDFAEDQSQLAAVIGHEVAHVLAEHGNERMSTAFAANTGVQIAGAILSESPDSSAQTAMALLGLGAQVGVLLPFSRTQETEADLVGLELMARSGFDPSGSVALWRKMSRSRDAAPPEFLSTHPAPESRVRRLEGEMTEARRLYESAVASGVTPDCERHLR